MNDDKELIDQLKRGEFVKNSPKRKKESLELLSDSYLDDLDFGYARIPNNYLEKLMGIELNKRELKVLLYIIRESLGYAKRINHTNPNESYNHFIKDCTGIIKQKKCVVVKAIKKLTDKGYIELVENSKTTYIKLIGISKDKIGKDFKSRPIYSPSV